MEREERRSIRVKLHFVLFDAMITLCVFWAIFDAYYEKLSLNETSPGVNKSLA